MTAFSWVLHDASGADLRNSEPFGSQADAEAWMGAEWSSLRAEGADSVSLMEDGEVVYRMSLQEA